GEHTTCEIPFAAQTAKTSRSGSRWSSEYCGCEEMNLTFGGDRASESRICSADHSENPTVRVLPARTTSDRASIVSSSGVSESKRWHWYRSTKSTRRRSSEASSCLCTCARESPRSVGDIGK